MHLLEIVCGIVGVGLLYCWTGRINALFFFGRTVPVGFAASADGRAVTRRYITSVAAVTLASAGVAWGLSRWPHPLYGLAVLLQVVVCLWCFAAANRRVRELHVSPATAGEQVSPVEVDLAAVPHYWVPGPVVCVLPTVLTGAAYAAALLRTGTGGLGARSRVLMEGMERQRLDYLFGMGLGMLLAACGLLLTIRYSARLRTRMAQYTVRATFVLQCAAAVLMCVLMGAEAGGLTMTRLQIRAVSGAIFVVTLGLVLWNQSRARRFVPAAVELGADDRWRWGLFYVDRNDPALFVQSRCGVGYGLNYGKRLAWPITAAFCVYMVLVLVVLPLRH